MAVNLSPMGGVAAQFFNNNGVILSGGKIYTYAAGSTTPQATYTSSSGVTAHTNPIVLDSAGRVPSGEIWLTSVLSYKFVLETSTGVLIATYDNVMGVSLDELGIPNVRDFGAAGNGVTNDTAAFTACRAATSGEYLIPPGNYVVDASPNVWEDTFVAPYGTTQLIIGGITYNISGAFGSGWKNSLPSTQRYLYWTHARTGATIAIWSDGELTNDSNRFFLPFDVRRDSHFFIAAPGTNGGTTDLLFRRSAANADPQGNRFAINFEEAVDRYSLTYATSASGAPSFDNAMTVVAGLTPVLAFPALPATFNQGWKTQTRAGGALKLFFRPNAATTATLTDETSGNVLQKVNRSRQALAGIAFDTLLDTPNGVAQPRMYGGVFSDAGGEVDSTLPVTKNLWSTTGASNGNQVIGTLMVASATSGGNLGYRETRFVFDGTTVTLTDIVNTLPAQITATVAVSGTDLQFQASYAGGLGAGCTVTAMINWCGAGR